MEYITIGNIWLAFLITLALVAVHVGALAVYAGVGPARRKVASFGGGLAVAYVFLHMLPELVEGNEAIGKVLEGSVRLTPFVDILIFIVALCGFNLYYGLELLARREARHGRAVSMTYSLHLFAFAVYNILISYTMPLRVQTGRIYAIIFTVAIGMHLFMTDRGLKRRFSRRFGAPARLFLIGSLLLGWGVSAVTEPINVFYASLLIAFLSGSILFNVFKEEIPTEAESSYPFFVLGVVAMALPLVLLTALKV
jgi:hypothetical protein